LFERAVGLYATLINVNAYSQPGVEAGKKAAGKVIEVQGKVFDFLSKQPGKPFTVEEIARESGCGRHRAYLQNLRTPVRKRRQKVRKTFDSSILRNKYASV